MKSHDNDVFFEDLHDGYLKRFNRAKAPGCEVKHFHEIRYPGLFDWVAADAEKQNAKWLNEYPKGVRTTQSVMSCIDELASDIQFGAGIGGRFCNYLYFSLVCHRWGTEVYRGGFRREGLLILLRAHDYFSRWEGALQFEEWFNYGSDSPGLKKRNAGRAGNARGQKFNEIKSEACRLLDNKGEKEDWKSKMKAAESVIDDLLAFIERKNTRILNTNKKLPRNQQKEQPTQMEKESLLRTLLDWSRNDEEVKAAFARVVKKKKAFLTTNK